MRHALLLARRALGRVAPNPAVGCVLVKNGHVIGRGWTQPGGRPHAEAMALAMARSIAGNAACGATAYVTLEPCAHHGVTPPCAEALITAGVTRVVAAMDDPDSRVSGRGFALLRKAGIEVEENLLRDEAALLNEGFFARLLQRRPLVSLKLALSVDGFMARQPGGEQWITGPEARRYGHFLRAEHDAILVGSGTVMTDDPDLTCRIEGLEQFSPLRVILDGRLRLPVTARLFDAVERVPLLVFTHAAQGGDALRAKGAEIISVPSNGPGALASVNLGAVLNALAERGITRLLVEGGAAIGQAFLAAGLVDRLELFRASMELGTGLPAPAALADAMPRFALTQQRLLGGDHWERWGRCQPLI